MILSFYLKGTFKILMKTRWLFFQSLSKLYIASKEKYNLNLWLSSDRNCSILGKMLFFSMHNINKSWKFSISNRKLTISIFIESINKIETISWSVHQNSNNNNVFFKIFSSISNDCKTMPPPPPPPGPPKPPPAAFGGGGGKKSGGSNDRGALLGMILFK